MPSRRGGAVGLVLLEKVGYFVPSFILYIFEHGVGTLMAGGEHSAGCGLHSVCPPVRYRGCFGKPHPRAGFLAVLCMGCGTAM